MATNDFLLWKSFLSLEKNLIDSFYYVEYSLENYKTFSLAYRAIILQACSDIEFAFKNILDHDPKDSKTIDLYRDEFKQKHAGFENVVIEIPISNDKRLPWKNWSDNKNPEFWQAYNNIKHQGKIEDATLKNAIEALAGLFAVLLAYYKQTIGADFSTSKFIKEPQFFSYPGFGPCHLIAEDSFKIAVPGFS